MESNLNETKSRLIESYSSWTKRYNQLLLGINLALGDPALCAELSICPSPHIFHAWNGCVTIANFSDPEVINAIYLYYDDISETI